MDATPATPRSRIAASRKHPARCASGEGTSPQPPTSSHRTAANAKFIRGGWRRQPNFKNEHLAGIFSAIFPLVGFLLRGNCRNQYVSTRIHVSLFCILLDLYFMSKMRSRSVSNQKEYCTKSVHVPILYIIRVIQDKVSK